jgi:hypothetical protein
MGEAESKGRGAQMKGCEVLRQKRPEISLKLDHSWHMLPTVSIREAKQRLGEFADRALQGEQIVIVRKSKLLVLKELEMPEPVPMRPLGYFDDGYDKIAAKESNKLAARSVRSIVK